MKLGISHWSIRDNATRPVEDALREAKDAGFDAIELAVGTEGTLSTDTDRRTCESYRAAADRIGVGVETVATGISWDVSPTALDAATREKSIALHAAALERAAWLGASAMLMVPGAVTIPWEPTYGPVPYAQAVEWSRAAAKRLADVAERVQVDLCLENVWNGLFYSPIEFAAFVDSIGSPRVGVYFDVGNVLGYHQHPPHWIELLGRRIRRVHVKDFKREVGNLSGFCDLLAGDVPWPQTIAALRGIGYDKTLVAEMMPPDETLLARTRDALGKIVRM
jgi:hexulose-6-phosphate isomerase